MPRSCCINGCNNSVRRKGRFSEESAVTFHSFPKNDICNSKWKYYIRVYNNQELVDNNLIICSNHFEKSDFSQTNSRTVLNKSAIPSIFPNSECTNYEVLDPENKENAEPNVKKRKLHGQRNYSNVSAEVSAPTFTEPIQFSTTLKCLNVVSVNNGISVMKCDDESIGILSKSVTSDDLIHASGDTDWPMITIDEIDTVVKAPDISVDKASVTVTIEDDIVIIESLGDISDISINKSSVEPSHISNPILDLPSNFAAFTPKAHRIRYPGDINESIDMSPNTARKNVRFCKDKIKSQAKEIYALKQKVKRQRKQIDTLKELLRKLRISFGLSIHAEQSIQSSFEDDIIEQLKEGRKTRSYSGNVKSFALTLNFYSNAAYQYVRRTFGKHLPSQFTMSRWYQTVNGDPGISAEAMTILKSMSEDMRKDNKKLYVTLMGDEMAIRTQLIWNHHKKQFVGYVDYGLGMEVNDSTEEASEALVFLIVPINTRGKLPVAYYFTNKLTGEEKVEIVKNLLRVINDTGAEVLSFTFDGATSNITMAECLGSNLNFEDMKVFFENPYSKQKVHMFLDICHMIKLVRNNWESKGMLFDDKGNAIKWDYIVKLEHLQNKEGLSLGTKLTKRHIHFHNDKMKVRLAVQVFSNRVADALTYCKDMDDFKGCEATIEFVRLFNDRFDALNSKCFTNYGYSQPLQQKTFNNFNGLFQKASRYICGLKLDVPKMVEKEIIIERKNVVSSGIKRGFVGFLLGIQSILAIYESHITNGLMSFLLGYKFSQDHIETLFAVIRSKGGFNNNPNVVQFKSTFKRLLMRNQLTSSLNGNCMQDTEHFLHFSKVVKGTGNKSSENDSQFHENVFDVWEDAFDEVNTFQLSEYATDVVTYVSGFVERTIKKKLKCGHCLNALSKSDVVENKLIKIKNRGGLISPQVDICNICKTAETILWSSDLSKPNFYKRLSCRIMRQFVFKPLFCNMGHPSNVVESEHSLLLIKNVVDIFLKVRLHHIAKMHNIDSKRKFLRSKCTKLVHFSHQ